MLPGEQASEGVPATVGEEVLNCWNVPGQSGNIRDDELAAWLTPVQAERQAYFFGQCFSGGMLDDLVSAGIVTDDGPGGNERFGCAATTHYETSVWSFGDNPHHYIDAVAGLANLTMIFEGGAVDVDPFEVAGEELAAVTVAIGGRRRR